MAGTHFFCEFVLLQRAGKGHVLCWQGGEQGADIILNRSDYGEVFVWVFKAGECL